MRNFLITLLCLTLTLPALADDSASYYHPATGLSFPINLAGMQRDKLMRYEDPAYGTGAGYQDRLARYVTVYLYPAEQSTAAEAADVTGEVKILAETNNGSLSETSQQKVTVKGHKGVIMRYRLTIKGNTYYSEAQVFKIGKSFYKLRLTGDPKDKEALGKRALEITKAVFATKR